MASSNTPGYKYLKFFKPEHHIEIAGLLKERPILKDIITLVLQNSDYVNNGWLITDEGSEWFNVKELMFFIGRYFKNYRSM
ncbi:6991_t:CDS:2 [Cetraspora pellucida]|uniref:6991_t:CDS:1 n=1 Tax=Cetraspora pellucida TaxID=1433469 RepID=A0A9N9NQ14_9GLOM|nr:6991_t:CDS:2 [Cetraspora pellucida]